MLWWDMNLNHWTANQKLLFTGLCAVGLLAVCIWVWAAFRFGRPRENGPRPN
jgi:hypothetical protein